MVMEGAHGNRGLLPSSTSIRLRSSPALPGADIWRQRRESAVDVIHPRCAGIDVSKRDAKLCVRIASSGQAMQFLVRFSPGAERTAP